MHQLHGVDSGVVIAPVGLESGQVRLDRLVQQTPGEDGVLVGDRLDPLILVHAAQQAVCLAVGAALVEQSPQDFLGLDASVQPVEGERELLANLRDPPANSGIDSTSATASPYSSTAR